MNTVLYFGEKTMNIISTMKNSNGTYSVRLRLGNTIVRTNVADNYLEKFLAHFSK